MDALRSLPQGSSQQKKVLRVSMIFHYASHPKDYTEYI